MNDIRGGVLSLSFCIENELILLALANEFESNDHGTVGWNIFCASKNGVKTTAPSEKFKERNQLYGGFQATEWNNFFLFVRISVENVRREIIGAQRLNADGSLPSEIPI